MIEFEVSGNSVFLSQAQLLFSIFYACYLYQILLDFQKFQLLFSTLRQSVLQSELPLFLNQESE